MAVKFDKDALLKHRFWILVSVTGVLTLTGMVYLQVYGREASLKALKTYDQALKGSLSKKPTTSPTMIDELAKVSEEAKALQSVSWQNAYKEQKDLFRWAPRMEEEFQFLDGKFAHEVKVSKFSADEKAWPEDTANLMHGKFIDIQDNWFKIQARKKDGKDQIIQFFRMTENLPISDSDNAGARVAWGNDLRQKHMGKLMAVTYQTGKYFGDNILEAEQDLFDETYRDQILDILKSVNPVKEDGSGVVQLKGWLYRPGELPGEKDKVDVKFIRFVPTKWEVKSKFAKEAWIAQENIWIQKEIYQAVKRTNDDISHFAGTGGDKKDKKGELKAYTFKNANFSLELKLAEDDTLVFRVTNLLQRRQKLDLNFRVRMNKDGPAPAIRVSGLPLAPGQDHTHREPFVKGGKEFPRTGIYSVEQVLTWETAAVKRIDHVSIGSIDPTDISHTHRNYPDGLIAFDPADRPENKEKKGGGDPKAPPGMGALGGPVVPPGGGGGAGGGGAGANKTMLPHGLWTDRYVQVSEQSRRIPVAVALIVDQDHVDRVLTHFGNSKFRFLESQVLLNQYTGSLAPVLPDKSKDDVPGGNKFFGGPKMPGYPGVPGAPGVPGGADGGTAGDSETNMEVVIYGIVTLYQRYPPRPMTDKKQ